MNKVLTFVFILTVVILNTNFAHSSSAESSSRRKPMPVRKTVPRAPSYAEEARERDDKSYPEQRTVKAIGTGSD